MAEKPIWKGNNKDILLKLRCDWEGEYNRCPTCDMYVGEYFKGRCPDCNQLIGV